MSDWAAKLLVAGSENGESVEVRGGQGKRREFVKSRNYRSQGENGDHGDDDEA